MKYSTLFKSYALSLIAGIIFMLVCIMMTGCETLKNPIQAFYNSSIAGDGPVNALSQMRVLVRHASLVYNPDITDAEFEEWVAKQNANVTRFNSAMEIIRMFGTPQMQTSADEYQVTLTERQKQLDAIVATR